MSSAFNDLRDEEDNVRDAQPNHGTKLANQMYGVGIDLRSTNAK